MELVTRKSRAAEAVKRFFDRYESKYPEKKETCDKLKALGSRPHPDAVDHAIGNKTWTSCVVCCECGSEGRDTVQLGKEPDYESDTAWICQSCLTAALALFDPIHDFSWALAQMRDGKDVRRSSWNNEGNLDLYFGIRSIKKNDQIMMLIVDDTITTPWISHIADLEATDWEIV